MNLLENLVDMVLGEIVSVFTFLLRQLVGAALSVWPYIIVIALLFLVAVFSFGRGRGDELGLDVEEEPR